MGFKLLIENKCKMCLYLYVKTIFQSLLTNVDSLVYVDTDVIFLSPLEDIWFHFSRFNKTQSVALAPESEDRQTGWYNRFARHPYYGELGMIYIWA